MKTMTKHPLRITVDALKRAFLLEGFKLYDNGEYPELIRTDTDVKVFDNPAAIDRPVLVESGEYAMRTQLLPFALPKMGGPSDIFAAASGKVFDGANAAHPALLLVEGIISSDLTFFDLRMLWKRIVKGAFGAAYDAELVITGQEENAADLSHWGKSGIKDTTLKKTATWEINVTDPDGKAHALGYIGTMTWLGAALLGRDGNASPCYAFSINVDRAAGWWLGFDSCEKLYDNSQEMLGAFADGSVSATSVFEDRCRDILRTLGYSEGFGPKFYPDGIYKKMNMIQDEWDLNNKGLQLSSPLGENTGLPTVLTPAIEQILSEKWAAGEKSAKTFEISHIFMPRAGGSPVEKLALSFGSYGEGVDINSFTAEVGDFLTKIGNKNHFYIPTDQAIAYNIRECRLILDEKMSYLHGNFGGISEKAEANFGIGTHAFMANLELLPLENKAKEEYGYIAPELR